MWCGDKKEHGANIVSFDGDEARNHSASEHRPNSGAKLLIILTLVLVSMTNPTFSPNHVRVIFLADLWRNSSIFGKSSSNEP